MLNKAQHILMLFELLSKSVIELSCSNLSIEKPKALKEHIESAAYRHSNRSKSTANIKAVQHNINLTQS